MHYALYMPTYLAFSDPRAVAALARTAEQAGWDGFFVWDDVAGHAEPMADPWVLLAAAAMTTERIKLGVLVTPLARRRPWKYARETATLDRLCSGRLVLGVGVGGGQEQFGDLGDEPDQRTRGAMLDEGLQVVTGLWTGAPFAFEGRYYHIKEAIFQPTPVQQPRIPIWVAGVWPNKKPLARMAQWDGMFPLFWDIPDIAEQQARLAETVAAVQALREPGRPPLAVVVTGRTPTADPAGVRTIIDGFAAAGATWWLESLNQLEGEGLCSYEDVRARVLCGPLGDG